MDMETESGSFRANKERAVYHDPGDSQYDWLGTFQKELTPGGYWLLFCDGMLIGEVYGMGEQWFHAWMQVGRNDHGIRTADEAIDDLIYAYACWNFPERHKQDRAKNAMRIDDV